MCSISLLCFCRQLPAGDQVMFDITASNTGNLRLSKVLLALPQRINGSLTCGNNSSSGNVSAAVLAPRAVLKYSAVLTVTQADIEGISQELSLSASGSSVLGDLQPVTRKVVLEPKVTPALTVTLNQADCTTPTRAQAALPTGRCVGQRARVTAPVAALSTGSAMHMSRFQDYNST
jgi:hypothetical protein